MSKKYWNNMQRENKIRQRASYKNFNDILTEFRKSEEDGMMRVFVELDRRRAFNSNRNAIYALESLMLLIEDKIK